MSWRDLLVVVRQAPQHSAIARAVEPEQSAWGLTEQLLALVADYSATLMWLQTADAEKGRNRPRPIPRPGVEPDVDVQKFGSDPVTLDALDDFLGWAKATVEGTKKSQRPRDPVTGRFIKVT